MKNDACFQAPLPKAYSFAATTKTNLPVNIADVMYRLGTAHEVFAQAMAVAK